MTPNGLDCARAEELLSDHLEGVLDPLLARELEDHVRSCSACAGLREALIRHQDIVLRSFAENLMTYAIGRRIEYGDMPAVRQIVASAAKNENRFSSFVLGIVNSAAFRMVKPEAPKALVTDSVAAR